eukprot:jgi/Tetstr1/457645/TSEL_044212.t1
MSQSQGPLSELPPESELDEMEEAEGEEAEGPELPNSDDDGEDLLDGMERDYRPNEALDNYEGAGIDDDVDDDMDDDARYEARQAAEEAMARRDRRRGRGPAAFEEDDDDQPVRRRRLDAAQEGDDEDDTPVEIDISEYRGSLREHIATEAISRGLKQKFHRFLRNFRDANGDAVYSRRITEMCRANEQSLEVEFGDLASWEQMLAVWATEAPRVVLPLYHETAQQFALELFPQYNEIHEHNIFVRIANLGLLESLRDIRQLHLDQLIRTSGVVTRRTGVFPQLQMIMYDCVKCGYKNGPFVQTQETEVKPMSCANCQSKAPFTVNMQETVYRNYQKITLQESPGRVPAGRLPRSKEVILLHDLIDTVRPGEEVEITGIYAHTYDMALNAKNGFPVFSTVIEANHINKREDQFALYKLTDEDRQEIHKLAASSNIGERVVASIAPSIYGHDTIKMFVALAMMGGQEKVFLKYIEKTAQRAVFTTGKGASAVGLTAAVHKDPITREWTLEGGALVLADRGVCLIDEFDKMNDQDRVSIHEAMEQQTISVSKAGIVTQLQARCSVIAAANPNGGRYDSSRTFLENVNLEDPVLSRFDCLAVIKDTVDPDSDERLADFVVNSHFCSHPDADADEVEAATAAMSSRFGSAKAEPLSQEMLRKYITYARENCHPKLQHSDYDKITNVYAELRQMSAQSQGMPITVRHLESVIRMSEAHARIHLREYVTDEDSDVAIACMLESFISTQKFSVQKSMRRSFRKYITKRRDYNDLAMHTLRQMLRDALQNERLLGSAINMDEDIKIKERAFGEKLKEYEIMDTKAFLSSPMFQQSGFTYDADRSLILHAR